METFQMVAIVAIVTFVCMAVWVGGKELLTRWLHNDWCHHDWDMWSGIDKENSYQYRFCKKCNKGERSRP